LRRLKILWPRELPEGADTEWVRILAPLDYRFADSALNEMRDTLMFPPTIADFRSAYYLALQFPTDTLALPGTVEVSTELANVYGSNRANWVYCWRCDMALTLDERDQLWEGNGGYDESRGLYHLDCPETLERPTMPEAERMHRNEYFHKRGIVSGLNATPVPYRG
jgi:hypothetical protein